MTAKSNKNNRESIRVCVRVRPPSPQELEGDPTFQSERGGVVIVDPFVRDQDVDNDTTSSYSNCIGTQRITLHPGGSDRTFVMDRVFDIHTPQQEVYESGAKPIVQSVLQGFNGAVIAYGQTSSGKTYTMEGPVGLCDHGALLIDDSSDQGISSPSDSLGIIPRMVRTLFRHIENADEHVEFQLKVSILEIYNEKLKDLIDPTKTNLRIREDKNRGIFVEDLSEWFVTTPKDVFDCIRVGQLNRATAGTNMNAQSSRSHLIFCLSVQQKNAYDLSTKTGKLYLVDLAGSEKVGKTGAEGQTLDEAKMINKSLACLGNVINALTTAGGRHPSSRAHIPYRDSKLTRVLEETLGGNSRTCLICTVSPSTLNEPETLSTLRFGQRAKMIVNKAVINEGRSLEAVERLLVKAEEKISFQAKCIISLELLLKSNGISLPAAGGASTLDSSNPSSSVSSPLRQQSTELSPPPQSDKSDISMHSPRATSTRAAAELLELQEEITIKNSRLKEQAQEISGLKCRIGELMEILKRQQSQRQQQLIQSYQQQQHESWASSGPPPAPRPEPMEKMSTTASMTSFGEETEEDPSVEVANLKLQLTNLQEVLEDERRRTRALRAICQNSDKPFQQKLEEIDVHLHQLTTMYQNLMDKNAGLKLECKKKDDKIEQKNRSITQLETNLKESRQKYLSLLTTCQSLSEAVASRSSMTNQDDSGGNSEGSRIPVEFPNFPLMMNSLHQHSASTPSAASGSNQNDFNGTPAAPSLWNFYGSFQAPNISKRLNIVKPLKGGGGGAHERTKSHRPSFLSSLLVGGSSSGSGNNATADDSAHRRKSSSNFNTDKRRSSSSKSNNTPQNDDAPINDTYI